MATTGAAQNDQVCLRRWVDCDWEREPVCLAADVVAVSDESRVPAPPGVTLADPDASYFIAIDSATEADAPRFAISRLRYGGVPPDERQMRNWCRRSDPAIAVECMAPAGGSACTLILSAGDDARVYVASSSATQVLRPVGTRAQFASVVRAQGMADAVQQLARGAALFCHLADYRLTPTMLFEHWLAVTGLSVPAAAAAVAEMLETIVTLGNRLESDNRLTLMHYDTYMRITAWEKSTESERNFAQARIKKTVGVNRALGEELADARRRLDDMQGYYPELAAFLPLFETAFPAIDGQAISRDWAHIKSP